MLRLILWPVLIPSFLFSVGLGAMMPVLVLAALELGASEAFAAAIISLMGIGGLISTVPVGIFIDKVGDRRTMSLATSTAAVLIGVTVVAMAFPTRWSLALFIAALLLRTPSMTAWNLARQAVVAEAVPSEMRGQAMTALGGTMRAGTLVGPLCGAVLLIWLPLWSVFAFGALTAVVATALMYMKRLTGDFDAHTARNKAGRSQEELAAGVQWGVVGLAGVAISTLAITRIGQPILIALWGTRLGWNESQISLMVAVGAAIELILMVPGGYLKDRLGRAPILVLCLLVYGSGFILAPLWPTTWGFIVAVVVMSIGNGLGAGINMTIGADLSPARGRAKFLSIWAMFTQVGGLGGPLLISALLVAASLPASMITVGAFALGGAVWTTVFAPVMKLPKGVITRGSAEPGR